MFLPALTFVVAVAAAFYIGIKLARAIRPTPAVVLAVFITTMAVCAIPLLAQLALVNAIAAVVAALGFSFALEGRPRRRRPASPLF